MAEKEIFTADTDRERLIRLEDVCLAGFRSLGKETEAIKQSLIRDNEELKEQLSTILEKMENGGLGLTSRISALERFRSKAVGIAVGLGAIVTITNVIAGVYALLKVV